MFFKKIKFSFVVSREGSNSSEISYFSQGSTSRKEIDFWGTTHSGNCDLVSETAGTSISGLQLFAKCGCNVKTFLHKAYEEKGKEMETGTKKSAAMGRMRMLALCGQHKALQEWSQHAPQALAGNMELCPGQLDWTVLSRNCQGPNLRLLLFRA